MQILKKLVLGVALLVGGCVSLPHDPAADLDTMNKRLVVVASEVRAVVHTANELYMAGMIPKGSSAYEKIDTLVNKLVGAYNKLKTIKDLAEFNKGEAQMRGLLLELRKVVQEIAKHKGDTSYGEHSKTLGFRDCRYPA